MWNLKDSNVRVGIFMKLQSYKKHLNNLSSTKSTLSSKNTKPWKPPFKITRNQNRYHKFKFIEEDIENNHLVRKVIDINHKPDLNTLMQVPLYVPSNKQNFRNFKKRQRSQNKNVISRQNMAIQLKIREASKSYDRKSLEKDWRTSRKYKQIISKKISCCDYRKMAMSAKSTRKGMNLNFKESRITQNNGSEINKVTSIRGIKTPKFQKIF